jgi:P4 family phage/plasmid primase-like protien
MTDESKALKPGEIRLSYIPLDWPLTPLGAKKDPYLLAWQNKPLGVTEIEEEFVEDNCKAIGLMAGPVFNNPYGLVWVDIDGASVDQLVVEIAGVPLEEALPKTLTICSGKEGRSRKLYQVRKENWKYFLRNKYVWHAETNREQLEVLWTKHQGALMGLHPETEGYFTAEGEGFEWANKLPELPEWLIHSIINKNVRQGKPATEYSRFVGQGFAINTEISLERDMKLALEAMKALPPDAADDYDIWITIGQSLHTLDESLLDEWDEWSKQSDKYKEGECLRRWKSFSKSGGRGVGSLIHIAQEHGWKPPQEHKEHKAMNVDDQTLDAVAVLLADLENDLGINAMPNEHSMQSKSLAMTGNLPPAKAKQVKAPVEGKGKEQRKRNQPANEIADLLLQVYKGDLRYSQPHGQFYFYELEHKGLWSPLTKVEMMGGIRHRLENLNLPNGFSANLMNDLFMQLQAAVSFNKWYEGTNYLLFANGVLNIETKELLPFDRKLYLTQRMPYAYDPSATCDGIIKWLKFTQRNDWERVQVLRAWLRAVLLGCHDMQKFVEIIGPGKSGKSTYANLAVALVGKQNTYSTDFNNLETNRFETIAFMSKKLLLFQDMDRWGGSVSKLKAITGGDWIRVERKYQSENPEPFQFHGLVMITANEAIQSTDYTSGLARRRLTIPFDRPFEGGPGQQRELIKFDSKGEPQGEFAALLPGLVNWLLDLTTEEMREYLMRTGDKVKYFKEYEKTQSLRSSPMLDWMEHKLCYVPGEKCSVGFAKHAAPGGSGSYVFWDKWLYASYCEFCKLSNVNIMSRNRFEPLFLDICQHQLKMNIFYKRTSRGLIVFNVALRDSGPGFEKYPSIVEVSADKEKFKEFYGEILDSKESNNKIEDENTTDE